jgi:hypothetical protein
MAKKGIAGRRAARAAYQRARKQPLGKGARFAALEASAAASGATNPAAVAAAAGRRAHGQKAMTRWSVAGRRRARKGS